MAKYSHVKYDKSRHFKTRAFFYTGMFQNVFMHYDFLHELIFVEKKKSSGPATKKAK